MATLVKDLGAVDAYAYAVEKGFTGTEEEFAELMASYATVAETAHEYAEAAAGSASEAQGFAEAAGGYKDQALNYKNSAEGSATNAANSASAAEGFKDSASGYASDALSYKNAASGFADNADASASLAGGKASDASEAAVTSVNAKNAAVSAKEAADSDALVSEGYAKGTQNGEAVESGSVYYNNNAKYFSEQSAESAAAAAESAAHFVIDSELSTESENAVQNKVITARIENDENQMDAVSIKNTITDGMTANFTDGADGLPLKKCIVHIQAYQNGTGDPSPDNIRAIDGYSDSLFYVLGKNLCPNGAESKEESGVTFTVNADGTVLVHGTASADVNLHMFSALLTVRHLYNYTGKQLILTGCPEGGSSSSYRLTMSKIGDNTYMTDTGSGVTFTVRKLREESSVYLRINIASGTVCNNLLFKPMIRLASDPDAAYVPYRRDDYSVSWSGTIGKIYGGDFNVLTGELTVTHGQIASYAGETLPGAWISDRDVYTEGGTPTTGAQVVYELATPVTYQLTANEVKTLLGINNLSNRAYSTLDVEYAADTKLYLEHLTQPDADMVADANITNGSYFMVGNSLYLATAAIEQGAAIVPGTNCMPTDLAAALNAINA